MRISLVAILFSLGLSLSQAGKLPPLGLKDISLMFRTGYSAAAVESETATRRFVGAIDPASAKALEAAGAPVAFIAALREGKYAVPPDQVAAVEEAQALETKHQAAQAEQTRKLETVYNAQQAQARGASNAPVASSQNILAPVMKGDLVTSRNGILSVFNDQVMENKKLIGLYFSGHWCGPCRKFTPQLVEYYNTVASAHPEFEIVFISADRSAPAMETYMRDSHMPWPAIAYDKIPEKEALRKYAGSGIPCLVIVDAGGKVVSDSYAGTTYLGPSKVLADLDQIFGVRTAGK